jgi:hypothetical protein
MVRTDRKRYNSISNSDKGGHTDDRKAQFPGGRGGGGLMLGNSVRHGLDRPMGPWAGMGLDFGQVNGP